MVDFKDSVIGKVCVYVGDKKNLSERIFNLLFCLRFEEYIFDVLLSISDSALKTIKAGKTALDIVDRIGCKNKIDKRLWVIAALMVLSKKEEFKGEEYVVIDKPDKDIDIPTEILF